jgi:hypothetical protein
LLDANLPFNFDKPLALPPKGCSGVERCLDCLLQIVRDGLRKLKQLAPANRWGRTFDFLSRTERIAQNASRTKQIETQYEFSVEKPTSLGLEARISALTNVILLC